MNQEIISPPAELTPSRRLAGLDSLRGLAILLVMLGHFLPAVSFDYKGIVSSLGGGGVLLFFYLSGFLIFLNVQKQSAGIFLLRRCFKLFPAYWANMALIVLMAGTFHLGVIPDVKSLLAHSVMLQEFTGSELLNNVYWTLQIEIKFYFVIAIFYYSFGARRIYALFFLLLLFNMALVMYIGRGSTLITYLAAFFPGIAAAGIITRGWNKAGLTEFATIVAFTAVNIFIGLEHNIYQTVYAIIAAMLLAGVLISDVRSILLTFLARISYSHYLYHALIGYILINSIAGETPVSKITALLCASALTVVIATLSFYLIERPGISLGYSLEKKLSDMEFWHKKP